MRRSFALRLAAAFAGVGIAAAALTAILVNVSFEGRFTSYLEDQQRARQRQLVEGLADSYVQRGGWVPADLRSLESLVLMDGGTLRLLDADGAVVWEPSAGPGAELAEAHRAMMGSGPLGPQERLPVRVNGALAGTAVVRLPTPGLLPQDLSFRSSVNRMLLIGGIVAGLAALAAGSVLSRRATAPARELTRAARAVAAGERSERVEVDSKDELGEMAQAFNTMADTIEEEDRLRRVFAAEVAHELRTPLTILRTQIEGIQDGVVVPSSPALASLHDEALRLTRLVEDLETLASADAAAFTLSRTSLDLRAAIDDAAREFAGPYAARDVRLSADLEDVAIVADPTRIRQVVGNLLSNALKFTPDGGRVRLTLRRDGDDAVISVSDTGSGIAPDELARVFDRFFRGRGVRARGSGIGLTVARELVLAHGGEIRAESEPGRGATFTVRLPCITSDPRNSFTVSSRPAATVPAKGGT